MKLYPADKDVVSYMEKQMEIDKEFPLSDLDRAIYYVEASRHSHIDTIRQYREDPESLYEKVVFEDAVGNEVFHLICIDEYNHILKVLHEYEGFLKALNQTKEQFEIEKQTVKSAVSNPKPKRVIAAKNQEKI